MTTATETNPQLLDELETRLIEMLDDFAGSNAETNADEGIDGRGVVLRIIAAGRLIEIRATIEDVTDDLMDECDDHHEAMMADPIEALSSAAEHLADAGVLAGGPFAAISNLVKKVQDAR